MVCQKIKKKVKQIKSLLQIVTELKNNGSKGKLF